MRNRFWMFFILILLSVGAIGLSLAPLHNLKKAGGIEKEWDITKPTGRTRVIDFTTTEGTWMSVDVSPDGQWIVFDLLAHIYRIPISGGEAECPAIQDGRRECRLAQGIRGRGL